MAFAPSFDLFGVHQDQSLYNPAHAGLTKHLPIISLAIILLTFSTAFKTPFPL